MKQQSTQTQYPTPTDPSAIGAQFGLVPVPNHQHSGATMDGGKINYNSLLNQPAIPLVQPRGTSALDTIYSANLDPTLGNIFTLTPTGSVEIFPTSYPVGYIIVVEIYTSGSTGYTVGFGAGFVANGTLTTVALSYRYYTLTFVCDGSYWVELSRTPAMLRSN